MAGGRERGEASEPRRSRRRLHGGPPSVEYVVKETGSNLWRNWMMTVAATVTIAVSLSLVGTALLLKQAVSDQVSYFNGNVNVAVFEQPYVTNAQDQAIRATISSSAALIKSCRYKNHQASYELMERILGPTEPQAVHSLTPSQTPPVFLCTLATPNAAQTVSYVFSPLPGVYRVTYAGQSIHVMQHVTHIIQIVFLVIALALLVSSLVLILNAVRMAIFARRREVGVMKLVGATNWFIRVPFMLEGLVQGLVGAVAAVAIVLLTNAWVRGLISDVGLTSLRNAVVPTGQLLVTEGIVIAIGVVVGAAGSAFVVRRFLDV